MDDTTTGPHFAVIETTSITIPGDERSRTNPGHGYPEHTVESVTYRPFATENGLIAYLNTLPNAKVEKLLIISATPLTPVQSMVLKRPPATRERGNHYVE